MPVNVTGSRTSNQGERRRSEIVYGVKMVQAQSYVHILSIGVKAMRQTSM